MVLLLVGCQSGEPVVDDEAADQVVAVATDAPTAPPTETPFSPTDTPEPTETMAVATEEPVDSSPAPTETATSVPTDTPEPVAEVQINGRNPDGTFFRGRSDAPVTIIDYSDFF